MENIFTFHKTVRGYNHIRKDIKPHTVEKKKVGNKTYIKKLHQK